MGKKLGIPNSEAESTRYWASPERSLWVAVITRAILDATGIAHTDETATNKELDRQRARDWILRGGKTFREVCSYAGLNPDYVQERLLEVLQSNQGVRDYIRDRAPWFDQKLGNEKVNKMRLYTVKFRGRDGKTVFRRYKRPTLNIARKVAESVARERDWQIIAITDEYSY